MLACVEAKQKIDREGHNKNLQCCGSGGDIVIDDGGQTPFINVRHVPRCRALKMGVCVDEAERGRVSPVGD